MPIQFKLKPAIVQVDSFPNPREKESERLIMGIFFIWKPQAIDKKSPALEK